MNRKDWLLLAIGDYIEPIQLQKILFKFARESAVPTTQRYIFEAYNWGPMAKRIYADLEELRGEGLVEFTPTGLGWSAYKLTAEGSERAAQLRERAPVELLRSIGEIHEWVTVRSFRKLLKDVYRAYPEMAEKSLFKP